MKQIPINIAIKLPISEKNFFSKNKKNIDQALHASLGMAIARELKKNKLVKITKKINKKDNFIYISSTCSLLIKPAVSKSRIKK